MKPHLLTLPLIILCLLAHCSRNASPAMQQESSEIATRDHPLSQTDIPSQPERPFRDVTSLDKDHSWGITDHTLWKTTDGGQSWTEIRTSPKAKTFGSNAPEEVMEKVQFINQENGWVVEGHYLIRTTDGGGSWDKQEIKNMIIRSFRFIDSDNGWAVGELLRMPNQKQEVERWHPVVYSTKDGGRSWHNLRVSNDRDSSKLLAASLDRCDNGTSLCADC